MYDARESWTKKMWSKIVEKVVLESFNGSKHGGKRDRQGPNADEPSAAASERQHVYEQRLQSQPVAAFADTELVANERGGGSSAPAGAQTGCDAQMELSHLPRERTPAQPVAGTIAGETLNPMEHSTSSTTAEYDASGALAVMRPTIAAVRGIPFTPQPVVDWLHQVLALASTVIQDLLGTSASFNSRGFFVDLRTGKPACGGMICAVWGTEMAARREQAMFAWDYDVDLAIFKTEDFEFGSLWRRAKEVLEPLGLRLIEHTKGFKYRICPLRALAFNDWKERYHLAQLENPGCARPKLLQLAGESRKRHEPLQSPNGTNCVDIEVYSVLPRAQITIVGTKKISVRPADVFPLVEGIFGPLRVPLPATPCILDAEYGSQWRHKPQAKVIAPSGRSSMVDVPCGAKRCVWPSVQLFGCAPLLGGFFGAGMKKSDSDIPWRFL